MAPSRAAAAQAAKEAAQVTVEPIEPVASVQQVIRADMLTMTYQIIQDYILCEGHSPEVPSMLQGVVTKADLDAAGVDFAWLLKSGAIVEAGYASVN